MLASAGAKSQLSHKLHWASTAVCCRAFEYLQAAQNNLYADAYTHTYALRCSTV